MRYSSVKKKNTLNPNTAEDSRSLFLIIKPLECSCLSLLGTKVHRFIISSYPTEDCRGEGLEAVPADIGDGLDKLTVDI